MLHCDAKIINFSMKRIKFSAIMAKVMQFEEWLLRITCYLPQIFTHSLRNFKFKRFYFFSVHNKNFFSRFYFHVFRESVLDWKIENLKCECNKFSIQKCAFLSLYWFVYVTSERIKSTIGFMYAWFEFFFICFVYEA